MALRVQGPIWEADWPQYRDGSDWAAASTESCHAVVVWQRARGWIRRRPAHFALLTIPRKGQPLVERYDTYEAAMARLREIVPLRDQPCSVQPIAGPARSQGPSKHQVLRAEARLRRAVWMSAWRP
ncbi:hypothetical protein M446_4982 [Methylobacterium sp. 4-46]|uniref:hypothetical protein n=1 Tax=unclassified Methylobacterium TaxID=2615210 RepID=UPI000165CB97|nr:MULTISPECIES: hypothetical protein [Methylobacterium]ACA19310.1 hypothetical protein M446_4982 [Methylobacterium sp. 4-46]WFT78513.1 hypothetical protein QA634_25040 [Methylobacterium nodulans]